MTQPVTEDRRARLEARIVAYHEQDIAAVLDLVDYLREDGDTFIAGGSLSIDQGNSESDLDVVLVGPTTKTSPVPFEHWVGSLRVDAWTRNTADVDALFRQAEAALDSGAPLVGVFGNAVQEQQLKLLHRIAFGVLVEGDAVRPSTTRGTKELALELLTREYAERARESAMIAGLALEAGQDMTAATVGRVAAEEALHAVLHGRGAPFSGDKWLAEQLQGIDDLVALHEEIAVLPPVGAPLGPYAARTLEIAGALLGIDLAPAALGAALSWQFEGLTLLPLGGRKLLASRPHGAAWELEPDEAAAWQALAAAADEAGITPHTGDAAQAALCMKLYEEGVMKLAWKQGLPLASLSLDLGDPR